LAVKMPGDAFLIATFPVAVEPVPFRTVMVDSPTAVAAGTSKLIGPGETK